NLEDSDILRDDVAILLYAKIVSEYKKRMLHSNAKTRNEARRRYDTFLTNMLEMLTISHSEVLELFKKQFER
ncbi:MAG: hypothetical protein J6V33_02045, partial [Bacteroidales bacterium]|nr:hypothetical protein [Bacteroidales bacterium]